MPKYRTIHNHRREDLTSYKELQEFFKWEKAQQIFSK